MDTQSTRVTREQAAKLAGVSPRQINRWSAAGLLRDITYGPPGSVTPATYDPEEVLRAAREWPRVYAELKAGKTDTSAP